jgi:hypothetical protein
MPPRVSLGWRGRVMFSGSDEEEERQAPVFERHATLAATSYPGVADGDPILWSRWDQLGVDSARRRLPFLDYSVGPQIWGCSSLGSVSEILNLSGPDCRHVTSGVLPAPPPSMVAPFAPQRPLISLTYVPSLISRHRTRQRAESAFLVYSLHTHQVVKSLPISGLLQSFVSNDRFTVIVRYSIIPSPIIICVWNGTRFLHHLIEYPVIY